MMELKIIHYLIIKNSNLKKITIKQGCLQSETAFFSKKKSRKLF